MQFLYPSVLWFSLLTLIPVIIHLFYFRRYKTVYYSNTELLSSVIKESKSQQKLRNLILLFLRILFILCLVFAFAQPYYKNKNVGSESLSQYYALYIDNTFSMNDEGSQNISLLEEAKSKAITFVQSLPANTKYFLYYHGLTHSINNSLSSDEVQKKISEIAPSYAVAKWSDVFAAFKQTQHFLSSKQISYVWFTDGQQYSVDYSLWEKDSANIYLFHTVPSKQNNVSIDSLWFEVPHHLKNQKEKLWVKITNHGKDELNALPIKLYLNDTLKATNTLNLAANKTEKIAFEFTNTRQGWHNGKVELADFPITFDNKLFFNFYVYESIPVAIVDNELPTYLKSFFKSDSLFVQTLIPWNVANKQRLSHHSVILLNNTTTLSSGLWSQLIDLVNKGTTLIFIPSLTCNITEINKLFSELGIAFSTKDTTKFNLSIASQNQKFFEGMFTRKEERVKMPWVKTSYQLKTFSAFPIDIILTYENNEPALVRVTFEKGSLFIFGFPIVPDNTNFTTHPLYVAVLHRMMEQSLISKNSYYLIDLNTSVSIATEAIVGEKPLELKNLQLATTQIPVQRTLFNEIVLTPGNIEEGVYSVLQNNIEISRISFNYSRKESETKYYSTEELSTILSNKGYRLNSFTASQSDILKYQIKEATNGVLLWKWLIILAMVMLLIEMAIIRLWKVV